MKKKIELPEIEPVRLRPVHGIRPGVYILAFLAAAAILAVFIIFFLPGILSDGSYVSFSLNTESAAIYMDGKYLGSGKGSVYYIPAGEHEFSFSVYGADGGSVKKNIGKHIFATLFVHRVDEIPYDIPYTEDIERSVIGHFASSIASWSRVLDFSDRYHYPPLFQNLASDAIAFGFADISDAMLFGALHVASETIYSDFASSVSMLSSSDTEYRTDEFNDIENILEDVYVNGKTSRTYASESSDNEYVPESQGSFITFPAINMTVGTTDEITFPEVKDYYKDVDVPAFSISSGMVSEYDYALFVEDNPYWAKSNTSKLIEDGMADDNYLAGIRLSTNVNSTAPIKNISWYAADAYAKWLSVKEGIEYDLPDEYQWTAASGGSASMMWEFTSSHFLPYGRLVSDETISRLTSLFPYDDAIVKGRDRNTTGAMDLSQCSEYAGFRVVRNAD